MSYWMGRAGCLLEIMGDLWEIEDGELICGNFYLVKFMELGKTKIKYLTLGLF